MDYQYIYSADTYCEKCGQSIRDRITSEGHAPAHPDDEETYDSGEFPKGPYPINEDEDGPFYCGSGEDCPDFVPAEPENTATELATQWELDEVIDAYIECALWSSTDNATDSGGEPLDKNYDSGDIAPETLAQMKEDCKAFLDTHYVDLIKYDRADRLERFGHDFWLNRNGHGAGFWDGDWPNPLGRKLSDAAKVYGSFDLYIGDDGKIHGA